MPIKKIESDRILGVIINDINNNFDALVDSFQHLNDGKGVVGPTGAKGDKGDTGEQGPKGDTGATGAKGDKGDTGAASTIPGPKGDTGAQGIQGLKGDTGAAGKDGTNGKDGVNGTNGLPGAKGDTGAQGLGATQKIILNAAVPAALYTNADVPQWSASYTSQGGQVLVRADITAWTQGVATRNWYLKKNGTVVATGSFFFNAVNTHLTMPPIQYVDTTGAGTATWSISVGAGLNADVNDPATITVTETVGTSNVTITKAAAYVNAGVFVTLDNIKCTVTTGGSRGLSVASVAGTFQAHISGTFGYVSGVGGSATTAPVTVTTTPSGSYFGWSFPNQGDGSTYIINDVTNWRVYRVTMMIGPGYSNNFISIERLY